MRLQTIKLEYAINIGNYQTMRIGAEWSASENGMLEQEMLAADRELNATIGAVLAQNNFPHPNFATIPSGGVVPKDAKQGMPTGEQAKKIAESMNAETADLEEAAAVAAAEEQDDELLVLNAEKEGDKRDFVTLSTPTRMNAILKRLSAGVTVATVFEHFRFDDATLAILRAAIGGEKFILTFGTDAFNAMIKAVEAQKDIQEICKHVMLAGEKEVNVWNLALEMFNQ